MRKVAKSNRITIRAIKTCHGYLTADTGKIYPIIQSSYSDAVPLCERRYWLLSKKPNGIWAVLRARKI